MVWNELTHSLPEWIEIGRFIFERWLNRPSFKYPKLWLFFVVHIEMGLQKLRYLTTHSNASKIVYFRTKYNVNLRGQFLYKIKRFYHINYETVWFKVDHSII